MPDVLLLKTPHWELVVWSKDISQQKSQLLGSMSDRGEGLPGSVIGFSVPLLMEQAKEMGVALFVSELPCLEVRLSQPIFFEHTQYEFEFIFNEWVDIQEKIPKINHALSTINELFHYIQRHDTASLRGNIDFTDNVGWFGLPIVYHIGKGQDSELVDLTLSFEVWPTMIKMISDIDRLRLTLEQLYPLWQYVLTEPDKPDKPMSGLLPTCLSSSQAFAYLWMAQFGALLAQFKAACELVLNAPHSRIVSINPATKDRPNDRNPSFRTDIKSGSYNQSHQLAQNVVSVDTPENRFIKMVLSDTVDKLQTFVHVAERFQRIDNGRQLPLGFEQQLYRWIMQLEGFLYHSLFKEVGVFNELEQGSVVLQRRVGYGQIFRQWHSLCLYTDMLSSSPSIEIQSMAKLYEVWCFIEIKKVLLALGFVEVDAPQHGLGRRALQLNTSHGFCGGFVFTRSDGVAIRLAHEEVFKAQSNVASGSDAHPSILLEATYSDGQLLHWLFDVRYPLQTEAQLQAEYQGVIEQMSYYLAQLKVVYEHPQSTHGADYGAFVLCPCLFEQQTPNNAVKNPFYKVINQLGVGVFPFLPRGKSADGRLVDSYWLKAWLKHRFGRA